MCGIVTECVRGRLRRWIEWCEGARGRTGGQQIPFVPCKSDSCLARFALGGATSITIGDFDRIEERRVWWLTQRCEHLKLIADPQADGSLVVTKPAGWTMPWGEPPVVDDDEDPRTLAMDAWRAPCTRCRSLVRLKDAWCRYDNDHDDSWRARGWPTQHTGPCCWSCMPHEPERYGWDWAMGSWGKGRATFSGQDWICWALGLAAKCGCYSLTPLQACAMTLLIACSGRWVARICCLLGLGSHVCGACGGTRAEGALSHRSTVVFVRARRKWVA
mmetsp:Transcript_8662/g.21663  ORF Transcript_8662/g.21663 Transcript_8662/m.21663 type:complete len:274 (+) Transcript_8662:519-1340(+)